MDRVGIDTRPGDTPISIFPGGDQTGDDAVIRFSGPVVIQSMNTFPSTWGSPMTIVGKRWGKEMWRDSAPGDNTWAKIMVGVDKEVDTLVFEGQWNHFDDINIEPAPDTDLDGYTDGDEIATGHDPNNYDDNPGTKAIADTIAQWTTTGIQAGQHNLYYGYRNLTADGGGGRYDDPAANFIEFAPETWNGGGFVLGGNPPWTQMGVRDLHPNGANNLQVHWVIRRWVWQTTSRR